MNRHILFVLSIVVIHGHLVEGFFSNQKRDCVLSHWTAWSEPYGFGQRSREQLIMRYPRNGGKPCPENRVQTTFKGSKPPTIKSIAKKLKSTFIDQGDASKLRDLLIIFDVSGSIQRRNFETAKSELAKLIGLLCPYPDPFKHHQAALISFAAKPKPLFDFNDKSNTNQVQQGIRNMKYTSGVTCSDVAFDYARTTMFHASKGVRFSEKVKQEVLILSDGMSNCPGNATKAAHRLQSKAEVFGLTIGNPNSRGKKEMTTYVASPKQDHLFAVPGVQEFKQLVKLVEEELRKDKDSRCAGFNYRR